MSCRKRRRWHFRDLKLKNSAEERLRILSLLFIGKKSILFMVLENFQGRQNYRVPLDKIIRIRRWLSEKLIFYEVSKVSKFIITTIYIELLNCTWFFESCFPHTISVLSPLLFAPSPLLFTLSLFLFALSPLFFDLFPLPFAPSSLESLFIGYAISDVPLRL